MTLNDRRLDSLATALSARERAVWRLRAFKEDGPEPAGLYRSTPDAQLPEVNDLLALANATHREITWYAIWLQARAETIALRASVVSALHLNSRAADRVRMHLILDSSEPITASEHARRLATAREELIPVGELAEWLLDDEGDSAGQTPSVDQRRLNAHERRLRQLVADGTLPGYGRGATLAISAGAFSDGRSAPVPLLPDWGMTFEIFPDEAAEQVGRLRAQRQALQKLLDPEEAEDPRLARLSEAITETVAAELTELWSELLALDEVVREVGEKFDGEEPLHPECRALLDTTRERVLALAKALPPSFGELILPPEPAPRVRHALAAIIEQEARLS